MKLATAFKNKTVALILLLIAMASSCKVHFITDYNPEIAKQIDVTSKMIDAMYLKMLETSSAGQRPYSKYADQYVDVEVELNSLLMRNKARTLNDNSVKACEKAIDGWHDSKALHKTNNDMTDNVIKLQMSQMDAFMFAVRIAEEAKKISTDKSNQKTN